MKKNAVIVVLSFLCILVQRQAHALTFLEDWEAAGIGEYVPAEDAPGLIGTGNGTWIVDDSASSSLSSSPNRARILAEGDNQVLSIVTIENGEAANNMWIALDARVTPVSIPVKAGDRLSVTLESELEDPAWNGSFPSVSPPPCDCIYLGLEDDRGNTLVYVFDRAPNYVAHTQVLGGYDPSGKWVSWGYHEVLVGQSQTRGRNTCVLELYDDFSATPGFLQGGLQIKSILFEITSIGSVFMDDLMIGDDIDIQAPIILEHPQSQIVKVGDTIDLSVTANGSQPFHYEWYRDGELIVGANDNFLLIESATLTHTGSYTVNISNAEATAYSDPAAVRVLTQPTIVEDPQNQTIPLDSPVQLSVDYEADGTVEIQWFKDGVQVEGATSAVLDIASVGEDDVGSYHAEVKNEVGSVTSEVAEIRAVYPATITADGSTNQLTIDGRPGHTIAVETSSDGESWRVLQIVDLVEQSVDCPGDSGGGTHMYRATSSLTGVTLATATTAAIYGYKSGDADAYIAAIILDIESAIAETQVWLDNVNGEYMPKADMLAGFAYLQQDDGLSQRYDGQIMGRLSRLQNTILPYWQSKASSCAATGEWLFLASAMQSLAESWYKWALAYLSYLKDQKLFHDSGAIFETPSEIRQRRISLWSRRIELLEEEKLLLGQCGSTAKMEDACGHLAGVVWYDENENGLQETDETPLPSVEVWIDTNLNSQRDEEAFRFEAVDVPLQMPDWFGFSSHTRQLEVIVEGMQTSSFTVVLEVAMVQKSGSSFHFRLRNPVGKWQDDIVLAWSQETERYMAIINGMDRSDPNGAWIFEVSDTGTFTGGGSIDYCSITLRTEWEEPIITDSNGEFSVENVGPGVYPICVTVPSGKAVVGGQKHFLGVLNLGVMEDEVLIPLFDQQYLNCDMNWDGLTSIIGDVPLFVTTVYFGDTEEYQRQCPDKDPVLPGDCNGDGLLSIIGDVPCFVDCIYFENCQ